MKPISILSLFLLLSLSSASSLPPRPFEKVYVFGDSYTDTGNTNSSTGPNIFRHVSSLPYGETFFHRPTGRYTNGRLVIDFVAESMGYPFFPPVSDPAADRMYGVNYAVGGCTAIPYRFFVRNNVTNDVVPESLETQMALFEKFLTGQGCRDAVRTPKECKAVFDDALIWLGEISGNDYNYISGSKVTSKTIQRLAIKSKTKFLKTLLNKGAKYMVVQGLQATGCLPISLAILAPPTDRDDMGCVASKNKESYEHNSILQSKLRRFRREFPGAVIVYADDWHMFREVAANAAKYGFEKRFEVCCGSGGGPYNFNPAATCGSPTAPPCRDPSRYMNWDGLHPTEALNGVLARFFLEGKYTYPTFDYLLRKKAASI